MIKTPTLLLDENKCKANIKAMAEKARKNNLIFRPHFKTHVSQEIGNWFREVGVQKITVSSLKMAEYFAQDGWKNITVAFPTNILEIETINRLAEKIQLNLLVESEETAEFLEKNLTSNVNIFIKIDAGYKRTGVDYKNVELLENILKLIDNSGRMKFEGFLIHSGHSYACRGKEEIEQLHKESISRLLEVKNYFVSNYPDLILSVGDTPTCSQAEDFSQVDEFRAGNFVFFDYTQHIIGSCSSDQIAVAMACPVVAIHKERNEILIHGGSVHFSKDQIENHDGITIFGQVVESKGNAWGEPIKGAYIKKLSQEHGTVFAPDHIIDQYKVGDIIKILPVHSCTNSDLMKEYLTTEGKMISRL
jgi:D-serine deaminase-like pyridoxal phosphate-dependent protein